MSISPRVRATAQQSPHRRACRLRWDASPSGAKDQTINLVGFAVPEAANKAIAAEFNKTLEGKNVSFKTSYGASGDQSRAVEGG